jgi:hypothetical protein
VSLKPLIISLIITLMLGVTARAEVSFNRDVRPIMSDTCFRCHGPDESSRMAGLRFDLREVAVRPTWSGRIPIVPGKPEKSEMIRRIFSDDPAVHMPPAFADKHLTESQKEILRQWVAEGAKYEGHWSFQPVRWSAVPAVEERGALIRNPIDAFIQSRLAKEGLEASPEADRRTLIRRVALDLTGLPPTPAEVEAFLRDTSPNAYEKLVGRLLASPRYAEKQAIHWLDAVRYADSSGFHDDNNHPAWPYRDYVLRALRDNKPFDQFTREQIAGDLLPDATVEQRVATAYNRILRTSAEGGVQPKEYLAKYASDRVRTTSGVWLGLTVGCAECHDHKFDPIKTKDFYAMKAFFADVTEKGIMPRSGPEAWIVTLPLPNEEQSLRLAKLKEAVMAAEQALEHKTKSLAPRQAEWERQLLADFEAGRLKWHYQRPFAASSANGAHLTIYNDEIVESNLWVNSSITERREPGNGLVVVSGPNRDNETYTIRFKPGPGTWTALGVQAVQDESLPGNRLSRGADRFILTEVEAALSANEKVLEEKLSFVLATLHESGEPAKNPPIGAIDGDPATGWISASHFGKSPFLALRFAEPVKTDATSVITVRLRHDSSLRRATIGRLRLALSSGRYSWPLDDLDTVEDDPEVGEQRSSKGGADDGMPSEVLEALKVAPEARCDNHIEALREHFQWSYPRLQPLFVQLERLKAARALLDAEIPTVMITEATTPRETRILPRANWMDESGEIVEPAIPEFLGQVETNGRRANRLDLANWIGSRRNPLTARAFQNRLWRQFFGAGLSKVLDDLGSQGERPAHLGLLDWLAAEFMQPTWRAEGTHSWDVQHMIRTIVTSHTYRQSSLSSPQLEGQDPDNRLLARQSRFRVDAEVVRDIALAVSGLLVEKFGGPSVRPYQPEGYWAAMNFPMREYSASRGGDLYRRSVYTHWQRTFLHPTLLTFDAPSREECTVSRTSSNTPLQALILLNDPIFVESARVFAQNILKKGGPTIGERIDWGFLQAVSRKPTPAEREILVELHKKGLAEFAAQPQRAREFIRVGEAPPAMDVNPTELAALMTVARAILNLHETITRN